jgi:putative membrane protein
MEEHAMTNSTDTKMTGAEVSTKLAVDRTRLAHERTMMAWLRTSVSLISFGFTIQKFFQLEDKGSSPFEGFLGPANLGRLMVFGGLIILILSTVQHRRDLKTMRNDFPDMLIPKSMATWISVVIAVLGIFAMISVMFRS